MRKMTVKRRCAMILVMSSNYRDSCLPYPQEIIDKTHHKLPIIANKRNEDLLTIIKVKMNILREKSLHDYKNLITGIVTAKHGKSKI